MYYFNSRLKINSVTQLAFFLVFAVIMNQLSFAYLFVIVILLLAIIINVKSQHFFSMIKRTKWFFIVMLLIFVLNTPGQHILSLDYYLSPTYEGLALGLLQVARMLTLLVTLSLIMVFNTKQQLISGFYFLLLPLKAAGFDVERFAARLWLTLDYVESSQQLNKRDGLINQLIKFDNTDNMQQADFSITFEMPVFKILDYIVLICLIFVVVYVAIKVLT